MIARGVSGSDIERSLLFDFLFLDRGCVSPDDDGPLCLSLIKASL